MRAPHSGWFISRRATRAGQAHEPLTAKGAELHQSLAP